jgi:hypothetical protein
MLTDKGADVNILQGESRWTALHKKTYKQAFDPMRYKQASVEE